MPLPIIIGAATLAAAAYGAKKGYDGYQKKSDADDIVAAAQKNYDSQKLIFDGKERYSALALQMLGELELKIGQEFNEFKTLANDLLEKINKNGKKQDLSIHIPKHQLEKIEQYTVSAVSVLGTIAGAGAASAATGFAVYGGVMALGAASTGTAISALSGAAATKATLAAIGGGSLATGGLGIAGGTAILGAAVTAPVLAIAGWAYDSYGEESLKNAHKIKGEVNNAVAKLMKAGEMLDDASRYAESIKSTLHFIFIQFEGYFQELKNINSFIEDIKNRGVDAEREIERMGSDIIKVVENGYMLAAILTDLITTPIFKVKEVAGRPVLEKDGSPVMLKDEDGSMVLNGNALDYAIRTAKEEARKFAS